VPGSPRSSIGWWAGDATVVTRNGTPVAALVPIREYEALEDAADELLAREAGAHRGDETVSMSELLADLFGDDGRARPDQPAALARLAAKADAGAFDVLLDKKNYRR
jgi:antitoxin (DNA-binding transcriptional repressor) of toxin-antitoxin stability system